MTIAVVGGTGTLGRLVTSELRTRGPQVRVLTRSAPEHTIDRTAGDGLGPALKGCDVVVDASNNSSRRAAATLVAGSRRLLEAEQTAGVGLHVGVSVVGCEQVPVGYYKVKADQERAVERGPVPPGRTAGPPGRPAGPRKRSRGGSRRCGHGCCGWRTRPSAR